MVLALPQPEPDLNGKAGLKSQGWCKKALEIAKGVDVSILEIFEVLEAQPQLDKASPEIVYQGVCSFSLKQLIKFEGEVQSQQQRSIDK
jgi:hypothetical protein